MFTPQGSQQPPGKFVFQGTEAASDRFKRTDLSTGCHTVTTAGAEPLDDRLHQSPGVGPLPTGPQRKDALFFVTAQTKDYLDAFNPHQEVGNFGDDLRVIDEVEVENQNIAVNLGIPEAGLEILELDSR